jgi:hypothetical protein
MPEIVLTEEQARIVAGANSTIVIRNPSGITVGSINPKEAEIIAEARRRHATESGEAIPGDVVIAHLAALQTEWERVGGFDSDYAKDFLKKLRAEELNG